MNSSDRSEGRLHSLDALRGFDMLWILGGREVLLAVTALLWWMWRRRWFLKV